MTKEEMKNQILESAKAATKDGQTVERHTECDTMIIVYHGPDDEYIFRYSEADDLWAEAEQAAEKFDVEPEDYILWISQGW